MKTKQEELLSLRLGFLDIESNGFSANYNFMLSWSIKIGEEIYSDVIRKNEVSNCTFDKRILKSLVKCITDKVDVLITYYGDRFDVPFIRSRCDFWGIPFFKYGDKYSWDLYFLVKSKLKLSSRSLDSVTAHYGIEGKTHLDPATWQRASAGNKESLDNVLEHNKFDVEILQKLFDRMKDYKLWTRKSI